MELNSALVTGANRGIGLEFVKQLARLQKPPKFVFATFRNENNINELKKIKEDSKETEIILIKMDVREAEGIEKARKIVEEKVVDSGLNLLINNAGVLKHLSFSEVTEEDMLSHFKVNTVAPVMVLKKMFPLLQKASSRKTGRMGVSRAAVLNISGLLGSFSVPPVANCEKWQSLISYKTSKAALNMAMRVVALSMKDQGVLVVNMCPGWVKTDMGTENGVLELPESVSVMMETLSRLEDSHHGTFMNRNGETIPY